MTTQKHVYLSMELILNKRKVCVYFKCDMFLIPCASFTSHLKFGNCYFKPCLCVNLCIISLYFFNFRLECICNSI